MNFSLFSGNVRAAIGAATLALCFSCIPAGAATVIFERTSLYHHILVEDDGDIRTLRFNGSWETKMSKSNPLKGHFEYVEYFQMPFLWNHDIKHVLMGGLGGGSTVRMYQHYSTNVSVDTVEIDPAVVEVAKKYFNVTEDALHKIHTNDARVFLRRTTNLYDVILLDAYATTRYGSSLPKQLTTKEFYEIVNSKLTTNGVLAYNVIGQMRGFRASVIGAFYKTMKEVFPQVYCFPAEESQNVVFICTKSKERFDKARVLKEGDALIKSGVVTLPTFRTRMQAFWDEVPPSAASSPLLTDDYGPLEPLLQGER